MSGGGRVRVSGWLTSRSESGSENSGWNEASEQIKKGPGVEGERACVRQEVLTAAKYHSKGLSWKSVGVVFGCHNAWGSQLEVPEREPMRIP